MKRYPFMKAVALSVLLMSPAVSQAGEAPYYLFTSFRGNGESGLYLALSRDGNKWTALNNNQPYLQPKVGDHKLMRDPCLARGPDGTFHLVWTTGWTVEKKKVLGYARSRDLVTWSPQSAIEVMQNEPKARNIWAPELFYDPAHNRWLVLWSSTVPGKFPDTDGTGDSGYNHRIYCATTPDFKTFSDSRLFFDPGFNVIDATLLKVADQFYLFFKDERKNPLKKNLRYAIAAHAEGPFGPPSEPFTGDWVEGPSAIRIQDEYRVYFDHYARPHYYGAVRSKDLRHWEDCSPALSFPAGHRHGTIVQISPSVAARLQRQ